MATVSSPRLIPPGDLSHIQVMRRVPIAEITGKSPLGKRSNFGESPAGKRASPAAPRPPPVAVAAPPAPETIKEETSPLTPRRLEAEQAVDGILTVAFQMERKIKEAEEDEQLPGEAGRMAAMTKARARRKSKELQNNFQQMMAERLEKVFHEMDTDHSGALDPDELKAAFAAVGRPSDDETIRKCIQVLDKNNDGLIDLEEFKALAWLTALG